MLFGTNARGTGIIYGFLFLLVAIVYGFTGSGVSSVFLGMLLAAGACFLLLALCRAAEFTYTASFSAYLLAATIYFVISGDAAFALFIFTLAAVYSVWAYRLGLPRIPQVHCQALF